MKLAAAEALDQQLELRLLAGPGHRELQRTACFYGRRNTATSARLTASLTDNHSRRRNANWPTQGAAISGADAIGRGGELPEGEPAPMLRSDSR